MLFKRFSTGLSLACLLGGAGCATTTQMPAERLAQAEAAVRAAEVAGATKVPRAMLHLKLAHDQLQQAKLLTEEGDEERGDMFLIRARSDAEVALELARAATAESEAQEINERMRIIERENMDLKDTPPSDGADPARN